MKLWRGVDKKQNHGFDENNMNILNLKYKKVWQAILCGRTSLLQIDSQFNNSVLLRSLANVQRSFTELYKDQKKMEDKGLPAPPRGSSEEL